MAFSLRHFPEFNKELLETLRRSAETTMHALVRTVFSRLHCLDATSEEEKLRGNDEETQDGEIKMSVSTEQVLEPPLPEELPTPVPEELNPPPSPVPSGPRPQCESFVLITASR